MFDIKSELNGEVALKAVWCLRSTVDATNDGWMVLDRFDDSRIWHFYSQIWWMSATYCVGDDHVTFTQCFYPNHSGGI